jgi:hypothetical protein
VIQGRVIDQKTKHPLPDVNVRGEVEEGWWELVIHTRTDAAGRFRLTGLPNAVCELTFGKSKPSPYLMLGKSVQPTPGLAPAAVEMALVRGTLLTGRVTDRTTGKPIKGKIGYATLSENKHVRDLPGKDIHDMGTMSYDLDADGRFRFVAPPGMGIITVKAASYSEKEKPYPQARIHAGDRMKPSFRSDPELGEIFLTTGGAQRPIWEFHAYRVIEPAVGIESLNADFQLDPGKTVAGKVVGPDGQPFSGVTIAGLTGVFDKAATLSGSAFTVQALLDDDARTVGAVHADKKLAGTTVVRGNAKEPPILRLAGWGTITGRLVDEDGAAVAGARVQLYFNNLAAAELHRHLTDDKPIATDAAGRFRIDVPFVGVEFDLPLTYKGKFLRPSRPLRGETVKAGETKALGDLVVKEEE